MKTIRFRKQDGALIDSGECDPHLNLLAHAQLVELDIGSECGGHGRCGKDRIRPPREAVLSPITDAERRHLTSEELERGIRLGCQCWPDAREQEMVVEVDVSGVSK